MSECSIKSKSYYTTEYSIQSKIVLYVRVQYKNQNHTIRPSIVFYKNHAIRLSIVFSHQILLYVRVQYFLKNPHCMSECSASFPKSTLYVRVQCIFHINGTHYVQYIFMLNIIRPSIMCLSSLHSILRNYVYTTLPQFVKQIATKGGKLQTPNFGIV